MTTKGMFRAIMALAIPSVIANITTPLLSMVDVAIMGHLGSAVYLAAIAVGGTMFNMLYWLLGFLRMGASGLTAQAYGRNDRSEISATIWRALLISTTAGLLFIIFQHPLCSLVLSVIDPDTATIRPAAEYFSICIWGAPAVLGMYVLNGWFLGMQSPKTQMWIAILINVVNIAISTLLVFGLNMGLRGAAFGTLTAQWAGFAVGMTLCLRRRVEITPWNVITKAEEIRKFFKVNSDIFLRTVCLVGVTMWFTRIGASQGALMLAANAVLMQFFTLFSYFMDGFAFAAEALCGRYHGENNRQALRKAVTVTLGCGALLATMFTLVYVIGGDALIDLLSDSHDIRSQAHEYLWWVVSIPLMGFTAFAWDGVAIGVSGTRLMLWSVVWASAVFFVVWWLAFPEMGNHGLWLAFVCYLLTRGVVFSLCRRKLI